MKLHTLKRSAADCVRASSCKPRHLLAVGAVGALIMESALLAQAADQPAAPAPAVQVAANVSITPKRLTLGRGQRSATVYIYNQGRTPATFDISVGDSIMLPTGDMKPMSEAQNDPAFQPFIPKLSSAKDMILATPRRATLAPGKGQTIRIRVTPPADGGSSEFRSHLTVRTVPSRDAGLTAEDAAATQGSNQLSFRITPLFGLSIPIIVRSGEADVRGEIRNPRLTFSSISLDGVSPARRTPILSFEVSRSGANSLFGNVEVRAKGGDKEPIGLIRGLGIYTEIENRTVQIPLRRDPKAGEQLEISFIDDDSTPGKVVARSSFTAP